MLIFRDSHQITSSVGWRGVSALYEHDNRFVFYLGCCTKRVCLFTHLTCNNCPLDAVYCPYPNKPELNNG